MKNQQYIIIFDNLLKGLEDKETLNQRQKELRLLKDMFEDLVYNHKFSNYTLEKLKDL
jgi:hypothetical protein